METDMHTHTYPSTHPCSIPHTWKINVINN